MKTDIYLEHNELMLHLAQTCARVTILSAINVELLAAAKKSMARLNVLVFNGLNLPDDDNAAMELEAAIAKTERWLEDENNKLGRANEEQTK